MTDAQRFHELTGLELPENYNAADILTRMKEFCREERYINFIKTVGEIMAPHNYHEVISIDYILNPPALQCDTACVCDKCEDYQVWLFGKPQNFFSLMEAWLNEKV